ncbi:MAG TPA: acetylglutamate kinase [Thermoanaerobaculia bacterium]|nr:acetylglutamate kinase [Thermoanaerobaculia bacterium]
MRVVKIGGRAQSDPRLTTVIRYAWTAMPGQLCIVHGGGDEMSAMQRALGREAVFIGGRRVTSKGDLGVLRMVLSGVVNKRLVNTLVAAGLPAVGLSGEDAALIGAELIDESLLGFAGRPVGVNAELLRALMRARYLPVISPVGYNASSAEGGALNVNGDDAAAAIAAGLGADELLLVADVDGVRDSQGEILSSLSIEAAHELITNGIANNGMAAKLEAAETALISGVSRVKICGLSGFDNEEHGTFITQSQSVVL